jgi:patatin-like phospholipase/acyl hydrolase
MDRIDLSRSAGMLQRQRTQTPWPVDRDFRILSIDGGGIKGLLPISLLALIEERYAGDGIGRYFDLIAGTSTGGIIALGFGKGMTAREIRALYAERGGEVFPPLSQGRKLASALLARRDPGALRSMVEATFQDVTLGKSLCRLCIPSLDAEFGGEFFVFKTPHHADYRQDWKRRMSTVALATSAAPYHLRPHRDGWNEFLDGGVWANNPTRIAVIEALTAFDVPRDRIKVLSLGCVESRYSIGWLQRALGGKVFWAGNMIEAAAHIQSQNALGEAGLLIGRHNLLRLASPHMMDPIEMDDWGKAMRVLPPIAQRLFDEFGDRVATMFLDAPAAQYVPIYPFETTAVAPA